MSPSAASSRVETFVLNALTDLVGSTRTVLVDERSQGVVESALSEAVSRRTESELRSVLAEYVDSDTGAVTDDIDESDQQFLTSVAERVADELAERSVAIELEHTASVSVEPRNAYLYTYIAEGETDALERLELNPRVRDAVLTGADLLSEGEYEDALETFETVAENQEHPDTVVARLLAAWTAHRAKQNETAIEVVTELLESNPTLWPAKLVGAAADHSSPSLFYEGRLAPKAFVRSRFRPHEESALSIDVGYVSDGDITWFDTDGSTRCLVVPRLEPDVRVRLQVTGSVGEFPEVQMYYLAGGVVDTVEMVPRTIEHELAGGPVTADARETLRFRPTM